MCLSIDGMKKYLVLSILAVIVTGCGLFSEPEKDKPQFDELTISDVTATSAKWASNRIVKSLGKHELSEIGFMYSTDPDIPTDNALKDGTEYKVGYYDYYDDIEGLTPNTTYYGCLYCVTSKGKYYKGETQIFTTHAKGDFSQAVVKSPLNDDVVLGLTGCYRVGTKVLVETTIKNTGIADNNDFRIYFCNYGDYVDGRSYTTHVEDDAYTDYLSGDVSYEMNGRSSATYTGSVFAAGALPLNSTKKLKIYVSGVPANVSKLNMYIMSYFYNYSGCPVVYMTFENVPIYK